MPKFKVGLKKALSSLTCELLMSGVQPGKAREILIGFATSWRKMEGYAKPDLPPYIIAYIDRTIDAYATVAPGVLEIVDKLDGSMN